jgi:hypothetical protein
VSHPYEHLPATAFWRPAVAEKDPLAIALAVAPPLGLGTERRLALIGGPFAAALAAALRAEGAVVRTDRDLAGNRGEGSLQQDKARRLDSPRQIANWLDTIGPAAEDDRTIAPDSWPADTAILLPELTEADGDGRGCDGDGFERALADLERAVAILAASSPEMRVLLAVSPEPIAATRSDEHVLAANARVKAVLRAATAELAEGSETIGYLPLYELVTQPPMRGLDFAVDGRRISAQGLSRLARALLAAPEEAQAVPSAHPRR